MRLLFDIGDKLTFFSGNTNTVKRVLISAAPLWYNSNRKIVRNALLIIGGKTTFLLAEQKRRDKIEDTLC